jgi:hypothetical protein
MAGIEADARCSYIDQQQSISSQALTLHRCLHGISSTVNS